MKAKDKIGTLLLGFALLWLLVVVYIYSSLSESSPGQPFKNLHKHNNNNNRGGGGGSGSPGRRRSSNSHGGGGGGSVVVSTDGDPLQKNIIVVDNNNHNPWYGWQPPVAAKMECSWRTCLKTDHTCGTCRDSLAEWGTADSVPIPPDDWIPDVTMLKRMYLDGVDANGNPWPPPLLLLSSSSSDNNENDNHNTKELCEAIGPSGGKFDDNLKLIQSVPIRAEPFTYEGPKVLCLMYTMEKVHHSNIRAIRETWGPGCDGYLAFSTKSDPRIPAISLPHDGPEEYNNMWQKVRSIWRFVGRHYLDDFDFFYIGGEDMYVMPQNLRNYLSTVDMTNEDHFLGRRFKGYGAKDNYFNSGGAGYVLSRSILKKFYETGLDDPRCNPNRHTAMEDVMIAECLRKVFDIGIEDTRDELGRERFHPFSPGSHLTWRPPPEGFKADWYEEYNKEWGLKLGVECCAPDSVSFHYIKKPTMMRHLHKLLYGGCDSN